MALSKEAATNRLKWIKALKSGEFTKITEHLRDGKSKKMCSLGVACEVYRRETGKGRWTKNGEFVVNEPRYTVPEHDTVGTFYGFKSDGFNEFNPLLGTKPVTDWNDLEGATFKDIAKKIERTIR